MNEISLLIKRLRPTPGNVMVWLVVVMLIFAILGVTMLSLFSTAISSTAVQNDTRRAVYLSESGIRFARSQLWAGDFSESTIEELNDPNKKYTLTGVGTFDIDLFSPWFDSKNSFDSSVDENVIDLEMGEGVIPDGFDQVFPVGNEDLLLVNYDYLNPSLDPIEKLKPQDSAKAKVSAYTPAVSPAFQLTIEGGDADGFVAAKDEQVCLAALSFAGEQVIPTQGYLDLKLGAQAVFQHHGGAFEVRRKNFYYRDIDRTQTDRVRLSGVSLVANETGTVTVDADEPVIFSPRNLMILSEGQSGDVKFGKRLEYTASIADTSIVAAKSRKPDIEFDEEDDLTGVLSRRFDSSLPSDFISVNEAEKTLRLGGTGPTFGAVWFKPLQPRSIGGQRNFCTSNGCLFGSGIRVFFTLEYTDTGEGLDGIVFTLLNGNPQKNDASSAGGDGERSELLGYAGDSRLTSSPTKAEDFLDNSGPVIGSPVRGLRPPKIGLEFDNRVNRNDDFERTLEYCSSSTSLDVNTRNDPGEPATDNRDAVQYVFWANSSLDVPCRREPFCQSNPACLGDPSYDDNRHDAVSGVDSQTNWPFPASGNIDNAPVIGPGPDFTVYFGTTEETINLYAIRPDGTQRWVYPSSGKIHPLSVSEEGSIFFGSGIGSTSGFFHGVNAGGGNMFEPVAVSGRPDTKPAIDEDGTIYICTSLYNVPTSFQVGRIYAFRPGGTLKPGWPVINNPVPIPSTQLRSPALSPSGSKLIVASTDGFIRGFNTSDGGIVFGEKHTEFSGEPSDPVVVTDGAGSFNIYIRDNYRIYKLDADGKTIWISPSLPHSGSLSTAPAVGLGNSVYVGGFDGYLYAVSTADGTKKWDYKHPEAFNGIQSTPVIDGNGHIYFGTDHNYVYALTDRSTEAGLKWRFLVGNNIKGSPAVKGDDTVYAGTSGFKLYAINPFDGPKNYKDRLITSYPGPKVGGTNEASRATVALQDEGDWLQGTAGKRQWAVRMEVTRSQTASADGTFEYTLETWVRQCTSVDCGDVLGSFYSDTRIDYAPIDYAPAEHPVQLQQTVKLDSGGHQDFDRFLFGFTAATASAQAQTANIRKFQLSFIRPGDSVIESDPWGP